MGPPGEKPQIPLYMMVDLKGIKGDRGHFGNQGFTGPRGVQLQSDISHHSFPLNSSILSLPHITYSFPQVLRVYPVYRAMRELTVFLETPALRKVTKVIQVHRGCRG